MRVNNSKVCLLLFCISLIGLQLKAQTKNIEPAFLERFRAPLGLEISDQNSSLLYIVSRDGSVFVKDTENPEEPSYIFVDISDRITREANEQGLLGMAFSPDYLNDDRFYLYYTFEEEGEYYSSLSRFLAPGGEADPDSEERLLTIFQQDDNHNGGQIKFGPDGYLYLAIGDGGRTVRQNSQNTLNLNGTILRIDVSTETDYAIPDDNPFVGNPDGLDEIYAWGFRNPWRISFDPVTGYLWAADVGQRDWESIYIVEKGKNYGWPIVEGSHCFPMGSECDKSGLEMPLFEYPWDEEIGRSITGGYVYRGNDNPSLYGKYIYGDFITRNIWALEIDHDTKEVISNELIAVAEELLPTFGLDSRGEIYIAGWTNVARIYRFEKEEPLSPPGVVMLVSPEDEATDVSVDPVLSWEAVEQGAGYRVQVSLSGDFESTVVDEVGIEETEFEVSGLDYETTYFWRVLASNEAGDGDWSEVWSFATEEEPLVPPGVVALVSPEDGAVDVAVDPVLSWEAVEQGTGYRVQVSVSGDFSSTVVDEAGIVETELEVLGLDYETTYFWRVLATNDAGDGDWSEVWSFTTEDEPLTPPGVVTLISPEDEATDVSVDPVLSWEAVEQGTGYRVQVALNSEFGDLVVDEDGVTETELEVSDLDYETTYFWRVLATNDAGDGDWSEVWSFTTEDEPLSPPGVVTLISPEDEATDVSVDPVLSWEAVDQGAGYRVQVALDSEFGDLIVDADGIEETEFEVTGLDFETTYFWRVRASNEAGDGDWSEIWSFVTEEEPLVPPGVVALVSPEDEATDVSVDPVLSWEAVEQGAGYRVQVSLSGDFDSTVVDEAGIEETEFGVTGLDFETTYFWRVLASNDAGDGDWSEVWSFTTEEEPLVPPGVVVLVSPEDEATDVSVYPVLSWEAVDQGAGYRVQASVSGDFESTVVDEAGLEETEFEVTGLDYETTYFWRVRASNDAGDGDWSEVWSFSTEEEPLSPPGVVTLVSPEDGATDVSVDPVLSWEAVDQGTGYRVQVALDSEFGDLVVDEDGVTETELEVSDLDYETTYFWRVRASNEAGDGEWSEAWAFETEEEPLVPPGVVTLVSPEDSAEGVSVDPVLSWEAVDQGTGYRVQVAVSGDFESMVVDEVGLEETEFEVSDLDYETTYFWRVLASNDAGDGDWSEVWSFVTEEEPLSPPGMVALVSPEDGAMDVSVDPVLSWQAVEQGAGYRVQVAVSGDFESMVVDEAGLEETEFEVTGLDFETAYFWRVLASNETGDGDWSEIWSFTTESEPQEPVVSSIELRVEGDVITIEWETEVAGLVDFFRIYRGPDPQELNEVAVRGAGELSFSESGQTGATVFYAVSAVSNSGMESELSEPVSFFIGEADIDAGWSMISIPTPVEGLSAEGAILYGFDGVYRNEELLEAGRGYWAKSSGSSALQIPFSGSGMVSEEMELNRGWNLIGSLAAGLSVSEIEDPDGILTSAPVYEYDGTVYMEADMMQPGAGYWIYAGNDGTVELRLKAGKADAGKYHEPLAEEITGRLTFRYQSHSAELKLSDMPFSAADKYRYLMPPMAPGPSLDVRTEDGFRVVDQQFQRISLHSPGYPLTIEAEMQPGQQGAFYRLKGREENGTAVEFDLKSGRIITISSELSDLRLERLAPEELITTTRLDPGYPNPFNPSTNIRYRLADAANVELEVFDMTGRRVATLVNDRQQAGNYTVQFDATALASGIYLVTLRADGLVKTQKVTLVK